MRFIVVFISVLIFLSFVLAKSTKAIIDPLASANNKFGIHILDTQDITDAADLVNSSGGDWGYVTLVIREDERDIKNWQKVFDDLRRLHLIPIVRLATTQQDDGWKKFNSDDIDSWVYFLNSLNWVVKNRYLIVGNEPNHAREWGGQINPQEYGQILCHFNQKLKEASADFFVLPAGLDASAPDKKGYMSIETFFAAMFKDKSVAGCFDGFTSHSYPNPDFSGSPYDTGKGTILGYRWELAFLQSLGINKNFPVFITETGWAHQTQAGKNGYLTTLKSSEYLKEAFEKVWIDKEVVAITPFVLNYPKNPFDVFSWKNPQGEWIQAYDLIKSLSKTKGEPQQNHDGEILLFIAPKTLKVNDNFNGIALIKNYGQSIWNRDFNLVADLGLGNFYRQPINEDIEPNKTLLINIGGKITDKPQDIYGMLYLSYKGREFGHEHRFKVSVIDSKGSIIDRLLVIKDRILVLLISLIPPK